MGRTLVQPGLHTQLSVLNGRFLQFFTCERVRFEKGDTMVERPFFFCNDVEGYLRVVANLRGQNWEDLTLLVQGDSGPVVEKYNFFSCSIWSKAFPFFSSGCWIWLFRMCFGIRILSPIHLTTLTIPIQNKKCLKNAKKRIRGQHIFHICVFCSQQGNWHTSTVPQTSLLLWICELGEEKWWSLGSFLYCSSVVLG